MLDTSSREEAVGLVCANFVKADLSLSCDVARQSWKRRSIIAHNTVSSRAAMNSDEPGLVWTYKCFLMACMFVIWWAASADFCVLTTAYFHNALFYIQKATKFQLLPVYKKANQISVPYESDGSSHHLPLSPCIIAPALRITGVLLLCLWYELPNSFRWQFKIHVLLHMIWTAESFQMAIQNVWAMGST